jgi:hypothetical protein
MCEKARDVIHSTDAREPVFYFSSLKRRERKARGKAAAHCFLQKKSDMFLCDTKKNRDRLSADTAM